MRHIAFLLAVVGVVGTSGSAHAQGRAKSLDQICPKVQAAGSESSTIYKQSAPLRSGGVGTPLIGYRKEPTLIFNKRNFSGELPRQVPSGFCARTCRTCSLYHADILVAPYSDKKYPLGKDIF
jgi:hypothetical protein